MKAIRNIVVKIIFTPTSTLKEALFIIIQIVIAKFLVRFVPLRFYYYTYFSKAESNVPDKQLLHKNLRFYNRVLKLLPFNLTCLEECMVRFAFLKRHGILNPIRLGIRIEGNLKAHAWNDHLSVSDFKIIN
jgi:hypothetical protein